jgi:hypothetical protein
MQILKGSLLKLKVVYTGLESDQIGIISGLLHVRFQTFVFPEKIKKRTYQTIVRPNGKSYSGGKPGVWEITLFSVSSQTYGHLCV